MAISGLFPAFSAEFSWIFRGPACGLGPAWPQGAGVHSGGPACALAGVWVHAGPLRTRRPPGGRRVLQARPGIASGVCWPDLASPPAARRPPEGKPRESRGKASGGRRVMRERESGYVAAKRPASPSPWPRSGPHHTAERPVSPKGRFRHRVLELWDGFWTLTRFGALTAIRVMDINGAIFGSKLGFFRSGNHSGPSLGPQNPMVFPVRVQFGS